MQKQLHHISVNNIGHFFMTKKFKIWRIIRMRRKQKHLSHIISCSLIWKRFLFFSYTISICQIKIFSFHHQHFWVFLRFMEIITESRDHGLRIFVFQNCLKIFFFKITNCVTVLKYFCFSLKSSVDLACLWKELPEILN